MLVVMLNDIGRQLLHCRVSLRDFKNLIDADGATPGELAIRERIDTLREKCSEVIIETEKLIENLD